MTYWLDLFTGTTWDEFRRAGARTSGFRQRLRGYAENIEPGDVFLCYLTGVQRWVGALKVVGRSDDKRRIWQDAEFPVRFQVEPIVMLNAEHGVDMQALEGRVDFYRSTKDRPGFKGFVRRSPNRFKEPSDAELILSQLRQAEQNPVARPVDAKKLARKPLYRAKRKKGKAEIETVVSVPDADRNEKEAGNGQCVPEEPATTRHTEIQFHLLKLGSEMGLDLWVARNDRSRKFRGEILGEIKGCVDEMPTQFNEVTNRTIELIDVLWLKGNSVVAAFEVECTTSVYSGLLRMSDLLALQPNLDIKLYLVAPDERRDKVEAEILRPTFALRDKPLSEMCGFLPFGALMEKVEPILKLGLAPSIKPDFLEHTAEFFEVDEAEE
jgi:hypothetical protein